MAAELEAELNQELSNEEDDLNAAIANMSNDDIRATIRALENEIRIMNSDVNRIRYESEQQKAHVKDNKEKIKLNKQLPYLVANVIEIVEPYVDPNETDGATQDSSLTPECKGVVVKTSTRQTIFLPIPGLIRAEEVVPGELIGVNKVRIL
jgi:26S proteasome regulatory subunit T5